MSSEGSEYWIGPLGSRAKLQAEYINVKHSEEVAIPVADETASDYAAKIQMRQLKTTDPHHQRTRLA